MKKILRRTVKALALALVVFLIIFSKTIYTVVKNNVTTVPIDTIVSSSPIVLENTLPVDSFIIIRGVVIENESMSVIFNKYKIPLTLLNEIITKFDTVLNVKKIKSGTKYKVFLSKNDSVARYFLYQKDLTEDLLFSLKDTVHLIQNKKELTYLRKTAILNIKSSLWNAMVEKNIKPELSVQLENIFQWTVDFFGLQKGDYFKIIYEEQYIDSQFIGYGKIFASCFHADNKDIYAIPFIQNKKENYYDEHGVSLKRAFLKAPLSFARISSGYSNNRFHPVLKIFRPHHGVDYAAATGTPVHSIGEGRVTYLGWSGGGGKTIKIQHNKVYTSVYMHLSNYAKGLKQGSRVSQGQVIGFVGSTGLATGPHLDFRINKSGSYINPLRVISPPTEPVGKSSRAEFYLLKEKLIKELSTIEN